MNRQRRIAKVLQILGEKAVDACLLKGMDNIFYLTGFRGSEGALFVTPGEVTLLTDFRYITHAREVTDNIRIAEVRERRNALPGLVRRSGAKTLGFDSLHTTYSEYKRWAEVLESVELVPMEGEIEEIRRCKEPEEMEAIEAAVDVATEAFMEVAGRIRPGRTERDIANELDHAMRRRGAERPAFDTIVASGPRAALPHAVPTGREIKTGETVIIDFGAQVSGYCSDETCTVRVGNVNGRLNEIFAIVNEARKTAIEHVAVGMPIKELDGLVRALITEAKYGEYFRHSTGHGVGIAIHEAPAVNSSAAGVLEEHMVITIEPGIYVPSLGGVRLEDLVLVTANGPRVLTRIEKEALIVGL
jgi:Xaa-Pro aminopeptidase